MEETKPENVTTLIQPESPEQFDKRSFVILSLFAILIVVGGYLVYQKLTTESQISDLNSVKNITPTDQITDWKTYNNNEFGFEIKIPSSWIVENEPESSDKDLLFLSPETKALVDQNDKNCAVSIDNCMMEGLWYADMIFYGKTYGEEGTITNIVSSDGIKFKSYREDLGDGMYGPSTYTITKEGKTFTFRVVNDKYKNTILPSFKFTK